MRARYFLLLLVFTSLTAESFSQRVKRKGVDPIDISKTKGKKYKGTTFSIDMFAGKWQEVSRVNRGKEPADITDTLYFNFVSRNEVYSWQGNQPKLKGAASVESPGNILLIVGDTYTIISTSKQEIVLYDQDKYYHTFEKKEVFYYETLGKLKVSQEVFNKPVKFSLKDIQGKWNVYRKQADPGAINPPTNIISKITIGEEGAEGTTKGEITFYVSEETKVLPCSISIKQTSIEVTAEGNTWELSVYKADGKEFVFGDASVLLYYSKPY